MIKFYVINKIKLIDNICNISSNIEKLLSFYYCMKLNVITNVVHKLKNSEPEPEPSEPRLETVEPEHEPTEAQRPLSLELEAPKTR
jgi:hypothetical protein